MTLAINFLDPIPPNLPSPGRGLLFDVTGVTTAGVTIIAEYSTGAYEVVHDGDKFAQVYSATSTRSAISGGYQYLVRRAGGWFGDSVVIRAFGASASGVPVVATPNADFGELLWEWNGTDTSQFENTAVFFDDATIEGSLGLSVVNVGNPFGDVLRLDYTAFRRGGGFFPILASELTLPEQYVLYIRWGEQVRVSPNPRRGIVSLCWNDDGGTMNAILVERNADSTQSLITAVAGDTFQSTRGYATSSTYQISGNGVEQWWAVTRPNGSASAYARAWLRDRGGAANTMSFDSEDDLQTISGVGTNWDNIDMTGLPGIGAEGQTLTAETGSCDIADFRIYAYPG